MAIADRLSLRCLSDREVLRVMATEMVNSRDPGSLEHIRNANGRIRFKAVPPLQKVMTMADDKLINILRLCPFSDNYGLSADEIIDRY